MSLVQGRLKSLPSVLRRSCICRVNVCSCMYSAAPFTSSGDSASPDWLCHLPPDVPPFSPHSDPQPDASSSWFCSMHPDIQWRSCRVPEKYEIPEGTHITDCPGFVALGEQQGR